MRSRKFLPPVVAIPSTARQRMPSTPSAFRRWFLCLFFCLLLLVLSPSCTFVMGGKFELDMLLDRMASIAKEFASEIERVHGQRCEYSTISNCDRGNYHECRSEFPNPTCSGGTSRYSLPQCHVPNSNSCGGKFDFSIANIRLSRYINSGVNDNPSTAEAKEAVCYSLLAEDFMVNKYNDDKDFWSDLGEEPPQMYFGSDEGVFRIFPARSSQNCGGYDTTQRPWYIAATSGPKDVILILDVSGSMNTRGRLKLMKDAAKRVVNTLTVADHVGVVWFNSTAGYVGSPTMVQASYEYKQQLSAMIDLLEADGGTNFLEAFSMGFQVLEESVRVERSSNCHTAILFLTDGHITEPESSTVTDVIQAISNRTSTLLGSKRAIDPKIFIFSLGFEANQADAKQMACQTGGMWSHVDDGGDLAASMASYYKLFAIGLGDSVNEGFHAWVDPYPFYTGGFLGTTVSAPVYDRNVSPAVLIGAVGVDFTVEGLKKSLGEGDAGLEEILSRLVQRSIARCPELQLTECEIQSLRRESGDGALCPGECENFVGIATKACRLETDFPANIYANSEGTDKPFFDRACCAGVGATRVGGLAPSEEDLQCIQMAKESNSMKEVPSPPSPPLGVGAIIGIVVATVVLICLTLGVCWWMRTRQSKPPAMPNSPAEMVQPIPVDRAESNDHPEDNDDYRLSWSRQTNSVPLPECPTYQSAPPLNS